jgi:DNA-binding response OmpR family regulator
MRVLVVEDHRAMREMVTGHLQSCGFAVDAVQRADEAIAAVAAIGYDAVILDLGLPDMDGMVVLRQLRTASRDAPATLILTARDRVEDRIGGLNAGADDYILKPFDLTELEARLRAVLRRPGCRREADYCYGDLSFDPASRTAVSAGAGLNLTRREASVLEELIRAAGRIVVKDALEDRLYGFDEGGSANALEAAVSRLRRKLTAAGSIVRIEAVRGIGYRLQNEGQPK